jgi:hypothetical protein
MQTPTIRGAISHAKRFFRAEDDDDDDDDGDVIWTAWTREIDSAESAWRHGDAVRVHKDHVREEEALRYRVVLVETLHGEHRWVDCGIHELCLPVDAISEDARFFVVRGAPEREAAVTASCLRVPDWKTFRYTFAENDAAWKLALATMGAQHPKNEIREAAWQWLLRNRPEECENISRHFARPARLTPQLRDFLETLTFN